MSITPNPLSDWNIYDDDTIDIGAVLQYQQAYFEQLSKVQALTIEIEYLKKMVEMKNKPAIFTEEDKDKIIDAVLGKVNTFDQVFNTAKDTFTEAMKKFNLNKE